MVHGSSSAPAWDPVCSGSLSKWSDHTKRVWSVQIALFFTPSSSPSPTLTFWTHPTVSSEWYKLTYSTTPPGITSSLPLPATNPVFDNRLNQAYTSLRNSTFRENTHHAVKALLQFGLTAEVATEKEAANSSVAFAHHIAASLLNYSTRKTPSLYIHSAFA
ncbi:MAG: hypothetical protein J3Q66DRAFT_103561 [Benniella sp.]|nr:MAG: hypothetical protein J3Q66DRAFT_103561 [Benniella sp.]